MKIYILTLALALATILCMPGCKKEEESNVETGTVTDIDSNVYKTVKIGNQWWMAENLKVTRYRNGDTIDSIRRIDIDGKGYFPDSSLWAQDSTGLRVLLYSSSLKKEVYLYNGNVATDTRNICPEGWHLPTDEEWKELEINIGLSASEAEKMLWRGTNEGRKLKVDNSKNWFTQIKRHLTYNDNLWGTNDFNFSAVETGCMFINGLMIKVRTGDTNDKLQDFNRNTYWWSASSHGDSLYYRGLEQTQNGIFRYYGSKNYGFCLRCVKDSN